MKPDIEKIAKSLSGRAHRKAGNGGWMTCCPVHNDTNPSLSIDLGEGGKLLVRCFAGCSGDDVLAEIQRMKLLDDAPGKPRPGVEIVLASGIPTSIIEGGETYLADGAWEYTDAECRPIGYVVCYMRGSNKTYRPYFRPDGERWTAGYRTGLRPLYRLSAIAKDSAAPVWVFEGEKCADHAARLGMLSTTSPGGAKSGGMADWSPLTGRDVVIWEDNDAAGRHYGQQVAQQAHKVGARSVRRVQIETLGLSDGDDIIDWRRKSALPVRELPLSDVPCLSATDSFEYGVLAIATIPNSPPPPQDTVINGLEAGTVGALVAPGSTGKSMLAMEICVSVCGGANLLDLDIAKHGRVLYLAAEDPEQVLQRRLYAISKNLSREEWGCVSSRLIILPFFGKTDRDGHRLNLLNLAHEAWLTKIANNTRLVVLDTLSRLWDGDENSSRDASMAISAMERIAHVTGASVLFLHHANKASMRDGGLHQQHASRGSSVLTDNARWQGNLVTMSAAEAETLYHNGESLSGRQQWFVRLSMPKANYSAPLERDLWFTRGPSGVLTPAMVTKEQNVPSPKPHATPAFGGRKIAK